MCFRIYCLFIFYTILFLFYPGDSLYIKIFSSNRDIFAKEEKKIRFRSHAIPYVINRHLNPELSAEGVYIVDLDSFTPIFEKNSRVKFFPASTTKIITALTAFDYYKLDDILSVKRATDEGQIIDLIKGEKMNFENLLYGLLVGSGNDAAYTLADNYPGGVEKFIEEMNIKTKSLKMNDSLFKNPTGLDEKDQLVTAFDLALAGRKLLENKTLARIVSIRNITISDVDFQYFHRLQNINKLIGEILGVGGVKTGYTEEAGENLISFYKKNSRQFLIVILKSDDRFLDTKNTIDWIDSNVGFFNL